MGLLGWLAIGYLSGSLPFALWIGEWVKGVDVRNQGSGNLGATNVFTTLGKWEGVLVAILDICKAWVPIIAAFHFGFGLTGAMAASIGAIIGHCYPLFASFRGGKAIAVVTGSLLALDVRVLGLCALLFLGTLLLFRTLALSSLITVLTFPASAYYLQDQLLWYSIPVSLFIVYRHIPNIKQLFDGSERNLSRMGR